MEKNTPSYQVLTLVSGKGGVGKTCIAVNMACELASGKEENNVVLVDCDVYNHGATLWFADYPKDPKEGSPEWNLRDLLRKYCDPAKSDSEPELPVSDMPRITIPDPAPAGRKFRFLPLIDLPARAGEKDRLEAVNTSTKGSEKDGFDLANMCVEKYVMALDEILGRIAGRFEVKFFVLDCHPGPHPITLACSRLRGLKCNLVVSDFDRSTMLASLITLWHLHRQETEPLKARLVMNRLASKDYFDSVPRRFQCVTDYALRSAALQAAYPGIGRDLPVLPSVTAVAIPDLEEYRIPERKVDLEKEAVPNSEKGPLSVKRRGGNGFVLLMKKMLRKLNKSKLLDLKEGSYSFCSDEGSVAKAFESLEVICFPTRGLGLQGVGNRNFVIFMATFAILVGHMALETFVSSGHSWRSWCLIALESLLVFAFIYALRSFWLLLKGTYQIFQTVVTICDLADRTSKEKRTFYRQGGSPAVTTAVWWPRAVWFSLPLLGVILIIFHRYSHLLERAGQVFYYLEVFYKSLFTSWPFVFLLAMAGLLGLRGGTSELARKKIAEIWNVLWFTVCSFYDVMLAPYCAYRAKRKKPG